MGSEYQNSLELQKSLGLRKRRRKLNNLGDLIKELENQSELNGETGQIDPLRKIINSSPQLMGDIKEKLEEYDNLMNPHPQPQTPSQSRLHLPRSTSQRSAIPSTSRPNRHTSGAGSTPTTPNMHTLSATGLGYHQGYNLPASSPSRSGSHYREVPGEVLDLISRTFDAVGGRDWQEFIQGLGINLGEFDKIRLLPGEVESSERMYPDLRTRLPYLF